MSKLFEYTPHIPDHFESEIQDRLSAIERKHDIRFLFAIESGSRAWGFPSPDSDYDVRFVYARPLDWYLTITLGRDVIEMPIEGDWDINGWDVRKAIGLLIKPNPVLLEWLSSPIQYRWNAKACQKLIEFADRTVRPSDCANHYYHLARRQWENSMGEKPSVNLKKYFYTVRPILALRWIRLYPDKLPPMNFQELIAATNVPDEVRRDLAKLLELKSRSKEVGKGLRILSIDKFIRDEFNLIEKVGIGKRKIDSSVVSAADDLFRELVK